MESQTVIKIVAWCCFKLRTVRTTGVWPLSENKEHESWLAGCLELPHFQDLANVNSHYNCGVVPFEARDRAHHLRRAWPLAESKEHESSHA